jgi:hypothetical protein
MTGAPVRAKVSMRIRDVGGKNPDWKDAFEKAFGDGTKDTMSNLVRPEQKVSNLLNIGL